MEIYKDLTSPGVKEFESLLDSQLSKAKIEEGKLIKGTVTKITEKFIFLFSTTLLLDFFIVMIVISILII